MSPTDSLFSSVLVRYLLSLGKSLYHVNKNPQCSWACCLGVIMSTRKDGPRFELEGVAEDLANQDVGRNKVSLFIAELRPQRARERSTVVEKIR